MNWFFASPGVSWLTVLSSGIRRACHIAFVLTLVTLSPALPAADYDAPYGKGDRISGEIFVTDKAGSQVNLRSLLRETGAAVNVLYIFGGGDMGFGMAGHLWCQDSFEDTHILRTLYGKYQGKGVNFIGVAAAPVYHTQVLDQPAGVFFKAGEDTEDFGQARQAFVDSTLLAVEDGILPFEPYFDERYRLMFHRSPDFLPEAAYGEVFPWQGAFRAADETQFYGVPSFWILSADGEILIAPFRGNIYHPHGADVTIHYTFSDIDKVLVDLLD